MGVLGIVAGPVCASCGAPVPVMDDLTGLADRAAFRRALAAQAAGAREGAEGFALLLLDLDRFKAVNDTMGHATGDALLVAVAKRLRRAVRKDDTVGRLGGDEFAVLLAPPVDEAEVAAAAARIVGLLGQPFLLDGRLATVGCSLGAVLPPPGHGPDADMLMQQADLAMYAAKQAGGGRFAVFEPSMQEDADAKRLLEMDLRAALHLGQFELFYQPQMQLSANRLSGFEALIRWRHPERGLVPPVQFIGLAEELGLITAIGEWVIGTACREAAGWPGGYGVAVNVSPQQFAAGTLADIVRRALAGSGLPSGRLELEVTESALLHAGLDAVPQLRAIKAMGVKVSLDDFGTGYSSLTQLRSFEFDRVKIDRSFVDDEAVVRAVAALCSSLGMSTTVEGIETHCQMARLRTDGATDVQGYLLSRPVPASQVGTLIGDFAQRALPIGGRAELVLSGDAP